MNLVFEKNLWKVYQDIRENAPRWLVIMGYSSYEVFQAELTMKRSSVIRIRNGYVVFDEYVPGVRITAHPCFTGKPNWKDCSELEGILNELLTSKGIHRVQIRVFETAGRTIRKVLKQLGFTKEALLQNYARDLCDFNQRLISSEIWAIVR